MLCHEPRGHADMYGCLIVPPDDAGAALGVLFWHKDGWSTACGHGTIALGRWAVESGLVDAPADGETDVAIDVPSGRVVARVATAGGAVERVTFRNVPSYVVARGVPVDTARGRLAADVVYGGAIYATLPAGAAGLSGGAEAYAAPLPLRRGGKAAPAGTEHAPPPTHDRPAGLSGGPG